MASTQQQQSQISNSRPSLMSFITPNSLTDTSIPESSFFPALGKITPENNNRGKDLINKCNKLKIKIYLDSTYFLSGGNCYGRMELLSATNRSVSIGEIAVELTGFEEMNAKHYSGTQSFLCSRVIFQGPGLAPSNAVHGPSDQYGFRVARKGKTTFPFCFRLPKDLPSSVEFGSTASIRYMIAGMVTIFYNHRQDTLYKVKEAFILESLIYQRPTLTHKVPIQSMNMRRIFMGGMGPMILTATLAESLFCSGGNIAIKVRVRNDTRRRGYGFKVSIIRKLKYLNSEEDPNLTQIVDYLATEKFQTSDFIFEPGEDRVVILNILVPHSVRSIVNGSLFQVNCFLEVTLGLGILSKGLALELPIVLIHSASLQPPPATNLLNNYHPYHYQYGEKEIPPPLKNQASISNESLASPSNRPLPWNIDYLQPIPPPPRFILPFSTASSPISYSPGVSPANFIDSHRQPNQPQSYFNYPHQNPVTPSAYVPAIQRASHYSSYLYQNSPNHPQDPIPYPNAPGPGNSDAMNRFLHPPKPISLLSHSQPSNNRYNNIISPKYMNMQPILSLNNSPINEMEPQGVTANPTPSDALIFQKIQVADHKDESNSSSGLSKLFNSKNSVLHDPVSNEKNEGNSGMKNPTIRLLSPQLLTRQSVKVIGRSSKHSPMFHPDFGLSDNFSNLQNQLSETLRKSPRNSNIPQIERQTNHSGKSISSKRVHLSVTGFMDPVESETIQPHLAETDEEHNSNQHGLMNAPSYADVNFSISDSLDLQDSRKNRRQLKALPNPPLPSSIVTDETTHKNAFTNPPYSNDQSHLILSKNDHFHQLKDIGDIESQTPQSYVATDDCLPTSDFDPNTAVVSGHTATNSDIDSKSIKFKSHETFVEIDPISLISHIDLHEAQVPISPPLNNSIESISESESESKEYSPNATSGLTQHSHMEIENNKDHQSFNQTGSIAEINQSSIPSSIDQYVDHQLSTNSTNLNTQTDRTPDLETRDLYLPTKDQSISNSPNSINISPNPSEDTAPDTIAEFNLENDTSSQLIINPTALKSDDTRFQSTDTIFLPIPQPILMNPPLTTNSNPSEKLPTTPIANSIQELKYSEKQDKNYQNSITLLKLRNQGLSNGYSVKSVALALEQKGSISVSFTHPPTPEFRELRTLSPVQHHLHLQDVNTSLQSLNSPSTSKLQELINQYNNQ